MLRALALALVLTGAADAAAQTGLRAEQRVFGGLASDRALTQGCLQHDRRGCEDVVQDACRAEAEANNEDLTGVFARACDERAIAAWEVEMNAALAALRGRLTGQDLEDLERSQRKWRESVLADVQVAIDSFQGGTGAGLVAAHVQAQATARRALYLVDMNETFE